MIAVVAARMLYLPPLLSHINLLQLDCNSTRLTKIVRHELAAKEVRSEVLGASDGDLTVVGIDEGSSVAHADTAVAFLDFFAFGRERAFGNERNRHSAAVAGTGIELWIDNFDSGLWELACKCWRTVSWSQSLAIIAGVSV